MANTMSGFYSQNAKKVDNIQFTPSDRFIDPETNKPYVWELRPLDAEEEAALRGSYTVTTKDRKGRLTKELNTDKYTAKAIANTIVFPNLKDAALQDSYGVKSEEALLKKMLLSAEYIKLLTTFNKLNNYDKTMEELVDEVQD